MLSEGGGSSIRGSDGRAHVPRVIRVIRVREREREYQRVVKGMGRRVI
jgi:hypothetical protein